MRFCERNGKVTFTDGQGLEISSLVTSLLTHLDDNLVTMQPHIIVCRRCRGFMWFRLGDLSDEGHGRGSLAFEMACSIGR